MKAVKTLLVEKGYMGVYEGGEFLRRTKPVK